MMKFVVAILFFALAACATKNDVAIQTAHANARAQECNAVASIAQSGAASEAAVLMAARGCGFGPAPATSADAAATVLTAAAPIAGALINGGVAVKQATLAADTQRENISAGTARAQIDANVLTSLGQDQVVAVRPEVVQTTQNDVVTVRPEVITTPAPEIVQTPAPQVIQIPAPQVCAPDADGVLVCN